MRLSVISPTLNEASNVPLLVQQIERALGDIDYEILIVDDDSPDFTWSVAQEIASANPRVRVLRRMTDPGLSEAVIDGVSAARGDVVACIDADLQHDAAILPKMLEGLQQGSDVVVGSRHIAGGSTGEWNWIRRLQSWIATKTAQLLLGIRLKDPMSGYFMVWRKDFLAVKEQLDGKGFKILLEILATLHSSKITEIPYTFRPRTQGESKLSGKVVFQYVQQVWRLCSNSRHTPVRVLKSTLVGGIGVFINLAAMALLLGFTKVHDWRASAIASLTANIHNYILLNFRTYASRTQDEFRKLNGYLSYFFVSAAGLAVTTGLYAGLVRELSRAHAMHRGQATATFLIRMACQFMALLLGVWFNYAATKVLARQLHPPRLREIKADSGSD
jgi:dolichol-phosphate mannosyltransferase